MAQTDSKENIKSWVLDVQEDPETGDAIIQFPPDLLEQTGWQNGDILNWSDNKDGSWTLSKSIFQETTPEEDEAWQELERRLNQK